MIDDEIISPAVVKALADCFLRDDPSAALADERFARWLSLDLRNAMNSTRRAQLDDRADLFARKVAARMALLRAEGQIAIIDPVVKPARIAATPQQVREEARREYFAPLIQMPVAAGIGRAIWDEPCDTWVELPRGLPRGDYFALTVSGESMSPLFEPRDRILVKAGPAADAGTVVVADRGDDGCIVKYVSAARGDLLELTSLNPSHPPVTIRREPHAIVGTVIARLKRE